MQNYSIGSGSGGGLGSSGGATGGYLNGAIKSIQDSNSSSRDASISLSPKVHDNPSVYLVETFYISSKKNTVFQVCLTEKGLSLRKESNGSTKEQTILLQDIIGCRCLRSKRRHNGASSCACTNLPGAQPQLKVVEDNSVELDESDVSAYLYIYAYILKKNRNGGGRRERTTITLRFRSFDKYEDNNKEAQKWRSSIKQLLCDSLPVNSGLGYMIKDSRKILVLLNPKSGSGKARETFQQRVAPIFVEAEVPYDLHVTKYANYAREFVRNKDISMWKYIVVVGGDGIFFEVINGLFERTDWDQTYNDIGIGIIPCGSGNGLARSIAHIYNEPFEPKPVLSAALTVVRGQYSAMDLIRVETRSQIMFSFLSIGWGLISDIDIESERLRMIGYQRFTIWSVHRLISLRTYHGIVSYLPALNYKSAPKPTATGGGSQNSLRSDKYFRSTLKHSMSYATTLDCPECHGDGDCEACDTGFGDVLSLETGGGSIPGVYRPRLDSWYSANSRKSAYYSTSDSVYQSVAEKLSTTTSQNGDCKMPQMYGPASTIPALTAPVPSTWTIETGEFIMVHAVNTSHIASDCFFAPASELNDGIIWLCIIRGGASRPDLLKFLLGLSSGTHVSEHSTNEFIKMIPVTAFRIEPSPDHQNEQTRGHFTVDGECVEYGKIQGEIFPGIAKVMVPICSS